MFKGFCLERFIHAAEVDDVEGAQRPQGVEFVANVLQTVPGTGCGPRMPTSISERRSATPDASEPKMNT
jgi:hypothetical protein